MARERLFRLLPAALWAGAASAPGNPARKRLPLLMAALSCGAFLRPRETRRVSA